MRSYKVVDAFSSRPFKGNPVAVVMDAQGLSDQQMQDIAGWTNLSETTFILPAAQENADYRLRIFTPHSELPFAGHPTLGSAHAALEAGLIKAKDGYIVQECDQGLIRIAVQESKGTQTLTLDMPHAAFEPLKPEDIAELETIIGQKVLSDIPPAIVNVGAVWIVAQVADAATLLDLKPDFSRSARLERKLGVTGLSLYGAYPEGSPSAIEVRSFAPSCGVDEDPVCGSGNGAVAAFRVARAQLPEEGGQYCATQGEKRGRSGHIVVETAEHGVVRIGGACVTCVDGQIHI